MEDARIAGWEEVKTRCMAELADETLPYGTRARALAGREYADARLAGLRGEPNAGALLAAANEMFRDAMKVATAGLR